MLKNSYIVLLDNDLVVVTRDSTNGITACFKRLATEALIEAASDMVRTLGESYGWAQNIRAIDVHGKLMVAWTIEAA